MTDREKHQLTAMGWKEGMKRVQSCRRGRLAHAPFSLLSSLPCSASARCVGAESKAPLWRCFGQTTLSGLPQFSDAGRSVVRLVGHADVSLTPLRCSAGPLVSGGCG